MSYRTVLHARVFGGMESLRREVTDDSAVKNTALAKDLGSIPSTHRAVYNYLTPVPGPPMPSSGL